MQMHEISAQGGKGSTASCEVAAAIVSQWFGVGSAFAISSTA